VVQKDIDKRYSDVARFLPFHLSPLSFLFIQNDAIGDIIKVLVQIISCKIIFAENIIPDVSRHFHSIKRERV